MVHRTAAANSSTSAPMSGTPEPVYSYDVFDTAITRLWFHPTDLFIAVGRLLRREGLYVGDAHEWADRRRAAEKQARSSSHVEEVGLHDIYRELRATFGWSMGEADRARDLELDEERRAIRPIDVTRQALTRHRRLRRPFLFISDTYFDTEFVAELLGRSGFGNDVPIFGSAEHGVTKRTGRLYELVLAKNRLAAQWLRHTGDNDLSDVISASKRGIAASLFETQQPTRYEQALYDLPGGYDRLLKSAIAGSSRAARLQRHIPDPHGSTVFDTAANVAGPVLAAYVIWVLRQAQRNGIRRLYFLARDGQILVRIARPLAAWLHIDVECRYLYASRQSLFLPSLTAIDDQAREWFGDGIDGMSLRQVLARVDIALDQVAALLPSLGVAPDAVDATLATGDRARVIALLDHPDMQSLVLQNAAQARRHLLQYLRQEGFCDGTPSAIVDIGWKGRLQSCLSRVLATDSDFASALPMSGFYYGLARRPGPEAGKLLAFSQVGSSMNGPLLEIFCAADHGSVRRFTSNLAGESSPVLIEERDQQALAWGLMQQQQAIALFVDELTTCLDPLDFSPDELEACLTAGAAKVFALLTGRPNLQEATTFGGFLHANDQTHSDSRELAPAFSPADLVRWLTGLGPRSVTKSFWAEASIVRALRGAGKASIGLAIWRARRHATAWLKQMQH